MRSVMSSLAVLLLSGPASAQCIDTGETSDINNPIQLVVQDIAVCWNPSTGPVHHYHLYVNDQMVAMPLVLYLPVHAALTAWSKRFGR